MLLFIKLIMEAESLIDFNSPLRKCQNMAEPLLPLPNSTINNLNGNVDGVEVVGENPFDNVIFQLCNVDDPFEIVENQMLHPNKEDDQSCTEKETKDKSFGIHLSVEKECIEPGQKKSAGDKCSEPESRTMFKIDQLRAQINSNISYSSPFKLLLEHTPSPSGKLIESKFSKLYSSVQFDKQILDESSKCIDSGELDTSVTNSSVKDMLNKSEGSPFFAKLPKGREEVKAFVANRIEKCIEKALNQSRNNLNSSFKHRRSLSAASIIPGKDFQFEYPLNFSSLKSSFGLPKSPIALKCRGRSFSTHDLRSLNTNKLVNQPKVVDLFTSETVANNNNSLFNNGFRKSTVTSSLSSYGTCNIGFQRNSASLSNFLPSSSSFINQSLEEKGDSVFLVDKNVSKALQKSATVNQPEEDVNFLVDENFKVDLVDTDSSYSDVGEDISDQKVQVKTDCVKKKEPMNIAELNNESISPNTELPSPLSLEKVAKMELRSTGFQPKKVRNPVIPPIPVPLSSSKNGNLILKRAPQSENGVAKRGPMKAMVPLGNMVRNEVKKDRIKSVVEHLQSDGPKLVFAKKGLRKCVSTGSLKERDVSVKHQVDTPVCGRPVACSTPSVDDAIPLSSPVMSLQVSKISSDTPVDSRIHRRSVSASSTNPRTTEIEGPVTVTPSRKVSSLSRLMSGGSKGKQNSSDSISPGQIPVCTSTPLKAIPKNSSLNREKNILPSNRKLLPKENGPHAGKENRQPSAEKKRQPLYRPSMRRSVAK